jgi:hypothetical protein
LELFPAWIFAIEELTSTVLVSSSIALARTRRAWSAPAFHHEFLA